MSQFKKTGNQTNLIIMNGTFSPKAKEAMRTARHVLLGHHVRLSEKYSCLDKVGVASFLIDAAVFEMLLGGAFPEVEDLRAHLRPTCPEVDKVDHIVLESKIRTAYAGYMRL